MKAALSTEATTSADRWLNLWNTPDLAARTTIEWSAPLRIFVAKLWKPR